MSATGDFIVPHYNGQPFYDKPPIVYWMQTLCIRALGVNSLAVRLPSAIMALLLVAFTVYLTTKLFSYRAGIFTGFTLACCLLTTGLARMAILDMAFTLMLALSLGLFILTYVDKIPRWGYLLSWVGLALSVMTKGPAGAVIIGLTIIVFLAIRRDLRTLLHAYPVQGILITLVIALPWYLAANAATNGDFLKEFVFHQNLARAMGKDFQHNGNLLYYVPVFLAGFLPWSIFLPASIKSWVKYDSSEIRTASQFMTVWIAVIFILFSVIVSKLPGYIFPIYPAAAVLVGVWWSRQESDGLKWSAMVCSVFLILFAAAIMVGGSGWEYADAAMRRILVGMAISVLISAGVSISYSYANNKAAAFTALAAGYAIFLSIAVLAGLPAFSRQTDGPAVEISKYITTSLDGNHEIIAFDYNQKQPNMPSLPFYTGQPVQFIWDPAVLKSELDKPSRAVVITEAATPMNYLKGLNVAKQFGKYIVCVEKD
jgi:4-amino-4-deoxy-L-arabinose transferase-like glycosyltransferase